ncbi:MAG: acetate--CoA ligase family protein, partial [bacterium]|nr:acetate--CoA ligase family protein [bacterium]
MREPDISSQPDSQTLSEHASKEIVGAYGVVLPQERLVEDPAAAAAAAAEIGFPVVLKLAGDGIAHKTERGLVRVGLGDAATVEAQAEELLAAARPEDGEV